MASTANESAQAIAFNEVGRQATTQDPAWNNGGYTRDGGSRVGLGDRADDGPHHLPLRRGDGPGKRGARSPPGARPTPSTRSRRSRATCATRARASSTASTRTPTSTSRARSTSSTPRAPAACLSAPSLPVQAESPWSASRATGCFLRSRTGRSRSPSCARGRWLGQRAELSTDLGHDSFLPRAVRTLRARPRVPRSRSRPTSSTSSSAMTKHIEKRTVDMTVIGEWVEPYSRVLVLGCGRGELIAYSVSRRRRSRPPASTSTSEPHLRLASPRASRAPTRGT